MNLEGPMALLSSVTVLRLVDSMAILDAEFLTEQLVGHPFRGVEWSASRIDLGKASVLDTKLLAEQSGLLGAVGSPA
jgi:hypothetical protein